MSQKIKSILRMCMALFVLLSSVGVEAHTMYCHDQASVSLFVQPKACCGSSSTIYKGESTIATPSCCLVLSEDLQFEYENTVPDIQFADFSFDPVLTPSSYIGLAGFFNSFIELEEQNLPPPIVLYVHRSLIQVYII